jgi:hypothetical protein
MISLQIFLTCLLVGSVIMFQPEDVMLLLPSGILRIVSQLFIGSMVLGSISGVWSIWAIL